MPGPSTSASVTVSPGIGCLLSLFDAGSGLDDEDRCAVKSFSLVNSRESCWAAAVAASAAAARTSAGVRDVMVPLFQTPSRASTHSRKTRVWKSMSASTASGAISAML